MLQLFYVFFFFEEWTEGEDRRLRELATAKKAAQEKTGNQKAGMSWKEIAKEVTKEQGYSKGYVRTFQACQHRWALIEDGSYFVVVKIKFSM